MGRPSRLPGPWQASAACGGQLDLVLVADQALDAHPGLPLDDLVDAVKPVLQLCEACPVQQECRAWVRVQSDACTVAGGLAWRHGTPVDLRPPTARRTRPPSVYAPPPPVGDDGRTLCGTHSTYNRHVARGEPVDVDCRLAEQKYQSERHERRRRARGSVNA